jgi:cytochrome c oxidase subunit III
MDIPYTSQARPDTGLFNAKLGIWLFLASEVMLFGALFSAYILLRVGADPGTWPHGLLNIPIGTFNTTVLITSSVTVVLGWSALKMGNFAAYRKFQAITILCALGFLGIKSFEYKDKFTHYEVWMNDGRRVTGHLEGNPWFFTLDKARKQNMESVTLVPDAHHYAEKWEGHKQFQAELKTDEAAGAHHLPPVKIPTADIKRLSAFVPGHSTYFGIYFTLTALHALHVLIGALVIAYIWGPGIKLWKTDPERYTNRVEISGLFWHFVDLVWIFLFPVLYLL